MATNKPSGDGHRNGAVRERSQIETKVQGEDRWTKRDANSGQFSIRRLPIKSSKAYGAKAASKSWLYRNSPYSKTHADRRGYSTGPILFLPTRRAA